MRKSKMSIIVFCCMCIFLIASLVIVTAAQAGEKTVKYKIAAPATKMEIIPIPDMKGHAVGILERRGVAIFENGETAAYHSMIIFDSIKGKDASWSGYGELSYADGSTTISKIHGTAPVVKGVKLVKGNGEYIKGTGRFEGIKGKCSVNGKVVTPYTKDATKFDLVADVTSTYTLSKK